MTQAKPARWLIIAAFAAIYLFWGGSYIGIHYAVQTIPPFLMTGVRFVLGGLLLFTWARARGAALPTRIEWRGAFIAGFILFVLNNGGIVWADRNGMPSGMTALLIATSPLWFVLITWARGGAKPTARTWTSLAVGLAGMALLIGPGSITRGGQALDILPVIVVLAAAFFWSFGAIYAKGTNLPQDPIMSTSTQLLAGGLLQLALSVGTGEVFVFDPSVISLNSVIALIYLTVFSSTIAYSAFVWLMRVDDPGRVATYAYVNPVVAVFLGWLLAGEQLTVMTLLAAAVILASVAMPSGVKLPARWRRTEPLAPVTGVGD